MGFMRSLFHYNTQITPLEKGDYTVCMEYNHQISKIARNNSGNGFYVVTFPLSIKATKLVCCPSLYLLYIPNSPSIGNSLNCQYIYNLLSTFPFPESTQICRNLWELFWLSSHFIVQTGQILSYFVCISIIILSLLASWMCLIPRIFIYNSGNLVYFV